MTVTFIEEAAIAQQLYLDTENDLVMSPNLWAEDLSEHYRQHADSTPDEYGDWPIGSKRLFYLPAYAVYRLKFDTKDS